MYIATLLAVDPRIALLSLEIVTQTTNQIKTSSVAIAYVLQSRSPSLNLQRNNFQSIALRSYSIDHR